MISGEWKGVREAEQAIKALGDVFSQPVLEDALKKLAAPIAEDIRHNLAPHRRSGFTEEDIGVSVSKERREAGEAVVVVGAHGRKGGRAYILGFLEFGTFRQPARPVIRPAWDAAEGSYPERALQELRKAYERGIKRFSRRAS